MNSFQSLVHFTYSVCVLYDYHNNQRVGGNLMSVISTSVLYICVFFLGDFRASSVSSKTM